LGLDIRERQLVINGDSVPIVSGMRSKIFDGIITDPPYGSSYYSNRPTTKEYIERVKTINGIENDDEESYILLATSILPELYRVLKDDAPMLWFTNWRMQGKTISMIEDVGFSVKNAIIWDKVSKGMGDLKGSFGNAYEIILYATKGRPLIRGKRVRDIAAFSRISAAKRLHAHQKPIGLIEYWMERTVGSGGKLILDPFAGVGTTGCASCKLGNKSILIELIPREAARARELIDSYCGL